MIHSAHIVSNEKFLPWIKTTFQIDNWSCVYIIFNPQIRKTITKRNENEIEVSTDALGIETALAHIKNKDVVFHYFLDYPKTQLIQKADPSQLHYWYFFGADIYHQTNYFRDQLYGPHTKRILWTLPQVKFRYPLRKLYYELILRSPAPVTSLEAAMPRIKNILWYIEDEIEMIGRKMDLPPWSYFQFFQFTDIIPDKNVMTNQASHRILIGNSATIENNHLDVLAAIDPNENPDYSFSLPLTYGQFKGYKTRIKKSFKKVLKEKVFFLEEHLKLDAYYTLLNQHPVAIFLHYRQQGLGNIFYLIYAGSKVYLSEKSIIFSWLSHQGISVFSFESSFKKDFAGNNLMLKQDEIKKNKDGITALLLHDKNDRTLKQIEMSIQESKNRK